MWKSLGGAVTATTCTTAEPATPFGAVAVMTASPCATPVTTPVALTVAIAGSLVDQMNGTPGIGLAAVSRAVASSVVVPPTVIVAVVGAIVTMATSGGGVTVPSSLQAPKVLAASAQVPAALRCREMPTASLPLCTAPMSVAVRFVAGPLIAANVPSYE